MNKLIQRLPFRVTICLLLITTVGACSTFSKLSESKYSKISQDDNRSYKITLKDGTKYYVKNIVFSDSTLTVFETRKSSRKGYTEIAEDELPYIIRLDSIESVKVRGSSVKSAAIAVSIIVGSLAILALVEMLVFGIDVGFDE